MKKVIMILFTALLLTSCAQQSNEVSERSEFSEISVVSEVSKEISKEVSKQVSEERKKESLAEISETSSEIAEYPKEIIENIVNPDDLGDKTREYLKKSLESKDIYMNVTGEFSIFGGMEIPFNAELARSDSGVMEKFTFGENSVKILRNSDGTYLIDDSGKKAMLTGEAYDPDEKLETVDGLTKNGIANEILSQLSSSFSLDMLSYRNGGTEEYNGKNCSFEEYVADGKTVKIYFDGDKPVALKSIDGSNISEIEINEITNTPDKKIFVIPDGYEIVQ